MFEPVLQAEPIPLRLWREFGFAIREFRDNPAVYIRETFRDERQKDSKRTLLVAATFTLFFYSIFLALIAVLGVSKILPQTSGKTDEVVMIEPGMLAPAPPAPSSNHGGNGAGDSGGGQQAPTPVSNGQPPRTSPTAPIVAPDPRRTIAKPPDLAVAETIQGPAATNPQMPNVPVGLQTAPIGLPPSPGDGKGGGVGGGNGPGAGDGTGPGFKPGGKPGGAGTGPNNGGPGGVLGNNPNGPKNGSGVTNSKLKIYYMPEPRYTQEALKNGITGRVIVYVRCHADGTVSNARVLSPLGYGLDEEAIRVAMLVKFYPAIRNGQPVDDTIDLTITFRGTGKRPE